MNVGGQVGCPAPGGRIAFVRETYRPYGRACSMYWSKAGDSLFQFTDRPDQAAEMSFFIDLLWLPLCHYFVGNVERT